jgi:LysR family transcriptional regulator of gallate degradation
MLPLRHLRTLSVVARAGGVRPSSDALLRAASAISRSVALMESTLETPLFERRGRGMLPTPAGELVLARHARIRDELAVVIDEAGSTREAALPAAAIEVLYDERRLRIACELAEVRHMPSVGRALGISQPAVSAAIARLESALRVPLFTRTARGLVATELGARWVQRFGRVLAELRYLENDVAALRGRMRGLITVGSLPLARTRVLPLAINALLQRHPGLRIHSLESPYEQLAAELISGKVDFIIGAMRPQVDRALHVEPLFADALGVMAAATHPLARRRPLALRDLRSARWVLSRPGTPLRASLDAFFESHGERPPVPSVETGDLALVRGMLIDGGMLTVLSTHQLRYEVQAGDIRVLPVSLEGLQRHIGITTRSGARLPAGALELLDEIRRVSP